MKFASDEKVLKTYNYAAIGKMSETLTVTDKRVIISTEGKMPDGSAVHTTDEVKLNSIEKVTGRVASKRNALLLVLMAIFFVGGFVGFGLLDALVFVAVGAVLALVCLIAYFFSKKVSFYLELTTGKANGMSINTLIGNWKPSKTKKTIKINVDEKVAIEIIEEIGALILESVNK